MRRVAAPSSPNLQHTHLPQAEILAAKGDLDVAATVKAVAAISPAANLVRNAAHAVAQRLPGAVSGAGLLSSTAATRGAARQPATGAASAAAEVRSCSVWEWDERLVAVQEVMG